MIGMKSTILNTHVDYERNGTRTILHVTSRASPRPGQTSLTASGSGTSGLESKPELDKRPGGLRSVLRWAYVGMPCFTGPRGAGRSYGLPRQCHLARSRLDAQATAFRLGVNISIYHQHAGKTGFVGPGEAVRSTSRPVMHITTHHPYAGKLPTGRSRNRIPVRKYSDNAVLIRSMEAQWCK